MPEDLEAVDDRWLVKRLGHDPAAIEEFYRRHVRALTRHLTRSTGNPHDADDLVAATFIAAIESAGRYDPAAGPPRAWLFGIARNLIAMRWRGAAAEGRALHRLAGARPPAVDEFDRADARLDAGDLAGPALAALPGLPPAERELIELMVNRDLTVTEAAGELGIRSGTARMRLKRVRDRLFAAMTRDRTR
ncbi:RNA polymerase sigma factor [Actinoplanes couchii]|uniref:DNA-directed RNA polymerase sigma-70 factor n=1 Tax=Actinoplanes couchii TaxID=403638 RepID=A0ABQ3XPK1_9ACTN|nr:RNA polymerase sigma factor [Actinoplanes couchii]MDR6319065.1 RNA polymerase sigma-70 factor (ECF subfamily) [Actinoplanes couchii]GID60408.1 DNA-directed RNA polymerase sigma-70 factor [Actinoplanes couchii]